MVKRAKDLDGIYKERIKKASEEIIAKAEKQSDEVKEKYDNIQKTLMEQAEEDILDITIFSWMKSLKEFKYAKKILKRTDEKIFSAERKESIVFVSAEYVEFVKEYRKK